ncbi:MAG: ABC transporter permease, partial [Pseudomonadota bacterium]
MTLYRTAFGVLLSYWRRRPLQFMTLFLGLALATGLWSAVQAINAEAKQSYDAASNTVGEGQFSQLLPRFGDTISTRAYVALRRAGWQVSPDLEGSLTMAGARIWVVGIEPLTMPTGLSAARLSLQNRSQQDFAAFLRQQLVLADTDMGDIAAAAPEDFQGITVLPDKTAPSATIIADIGLAQRLLRKPGGISRLIVANTQPAHQRTLAQSAPGLRLEAPDAFVEAGRLTDSFHLNLTAFGLLSFAVGLFIVQGAIRLVFEE